MRNLKFLLGCAIFALAQGCGNQSDQEKSNTDANLSNQEEPTPKIIVQSKNPTTTVSKADDWWIVDGSTLKCRPPLEDQGVVIDPKELFRRYKTCDLKDTNIPNVVGVSCQGTTFNTIIFGKDMQACLDAVKHIKSKTLRVGQDNNTYKEKSQHKDNVMADEIIDWGNVKNDFLISNLKIGRCDMKGTVGSAAMMRNGISFNVESKHNGNFSFELYSVHFFNTEDDLLGKKDVIVQSENDQPWISGMLGKGCIVLDDISVSDVTKIVIR